jgi:hypothetical protein
MPCLAMKPEINCRLFLSLNCLSPYFLSHLPYLFLLFPPTFPCLSFLQVEHQESFDLGALLLGLLNFFGDQFDPRVTGISVARRCYFSRAAQTGPQFYPTPVPRTFDRTPQSHTSHLGSPHTHEGNPKTGGGGSGVGVAADQVLPSHTFSSGHCLPPQQLVIIPKAADRRHSFQANEHASSNPGRDKGRKYPPATSTGLQPTSTAPLNNLNSSANSSNVHTPFGFSSYVPYKFDPLFVEDPLNPGNNVGRNCFRVLQVQRSWSDVYNLMSQQLRLSARDGTYHSVLEVLVGKVNNSFVPQVNP